jgi:hypothetical protein
MQLIKVGQGERVRCAKSGKKLKSVAIGRTKADLRANFQRIENSLFIFRLASAGVNQARKRALVEKSVLVL